MKVIIPVAGIGSRLRPHTHTQPKALVPVAGKPILAHIIDNLLQAGILDFIFITGYMSNKVEEFVKENYAYISKKFILQEPREGTGHAVWLARHCINEQDEILIALGDTIFDIDLKDVISKKNSAVGIKKVDDPRHFGVAELNEDATIHSLAEKPMIPKSNLALVGLYKVKEAHLLMKCLDELIEGNIRNENEFQLTDGLMMLLNKGVKIDTFRVDNWYDCHGKESLIDTNTILLNKLSHQLPMVDEKNNTIIIPPVIVGKECVISNSIIGPHVSIGDRTHIQHSIIKESIIGSYSEIQNAVLHKTVIGSDASLHGLSQSLNLGDSTEIDFSI